VIQGRPGGLFQFSGGGAVRIVLASAYGTVYLDIKVKSKILYSSLLTAKVVLLCHRAGHYLLPSVVWEMSTGQGQWQCSRASKVAVDLASHVPCVKRLCGNCLCIRCYYRTTPISPPAPFSEDTYLQVSIICTSRFDPLPAKVKMNHL